MTNQEMRTKAKPEMQTYVNVDEQKIEKIMEIKVGYLQGDISREDAKKQLNEAYDHVTAQEFAICEQKLQAYGISDDTLAERMEEILDLFDGLLISEKVSLIKGHPIHTYQLEVEAIRALLAQMETLKQSKFIVNPWKEVYEKLVQINTHFSRKQNQLYPALERKGFDKPSKVMWTLENKIRDAIKQSMTLLKAGDQDVFLAHQDELIEMIEDMMIKEIEILFPTALEMISDEEFKQMRISDDEIGYCLIDKPAAFGEPTPKKDQATALMKDLAALMVKHGITESATSDQGVLDVSQGKLTLEQINLIFKHLKVDLSYVDEHEIFKFYSDTKHRVFPRSAGAIGREVQNCHPRESVHMVEEIIRAFRNGEQDEAEFWLEMGDKFIYIVYTAVRDQEGRFRGVLEMMQDATHVRSLKGSQRLLSWQNDASKSTDSAKANENDYNITEDTVIGDLVKKYPFIKEYMLSLSPKYQKLQNPILFKTMSAVATMEMIASRGGLQTEDLIDKLVKRIEQEQQS